jgi:tripartite-type tricarboxylate transporter receptor subunit TctC
MKTSISSYAPGLGYRFGCNRLLGAAGGRNLFLVMALVAAAFPQRTVAQENWPSQPIKLVVPFPAGGNTDVVARIAADYMQKAVAGSTFVVENRPGAGGIVGAEAVAKSTGDGYTFCVCSIGAITIAQATKQLRYDALNDLAPISLLSTNPLVVIVHPSVKANSVQELVALARAEPNRLTYSSAGIGGLTYFAAELFKFKTGAQITHVPYRGGAPATLAVVAGNTQLTFANMSDALGQLEGGTVRALGVTTTKRSSAMPNVPTLVEQGIAGFSAESWNALFAPKGTPQAIVDRLAALAAEMAKDGMIQKRMTEVGSAALANSPQEFSEMLRQETMEWASRVKEMGLK